MMFASSLQETADTLLPTWTRGIQAKAVGCFIIDAPMGLLGDTAWTLEQLVSVILQINCTFTPPFTIVIYSLYGMGELQRALADQASPQRGGVQEKLQLTNFIVVKVKHLHTCSSYLFITLRQNF